MFATKQEIIERIDLIADVQRAKIVGDPVRAFEYQAAEQGARSYADAGYTGSVPGVVQVWADARGWTPQQAADNILAEATQFQGALVFIRGTRLQAKYAVMDVAVTLEQANEIGMAAISALKGLG